MEGGGLTLPVNIFLGVQIFSGGVEKFLRGLENIRGGGLKNFPGGGGGENFLGRWGG